MTPKLFESLIAELIDENPFAIRAVLRLLKIEFTNAVPTLAVTCETSPRLLVNLDFLNEHAHTEAQAKAVIVHEFLHVLLRHTEGHQPLSPARHLAFDAVINAIIHRQLGTEYSSMMSTYYAREDGLKKLLRPMNGDEIAWLQKNYKKGPLWANAWAGLYEGRLLADDIAELADSIAASGLSSKDGDSGPFGLAEGLHGTSGLLGDHDHLGESTYGTLSQALGDALQQMNGHGIWRSPKGRGIGGPLIDAEILAEVSPTRKWEAKTLEVLRKHITPDKLHRQRRDRSSTYRLPVLSSGDRRAFLQALWSPFIPEATWDSSRDLPEGTAQVYLDVSGSMDLELPLIVNLLNRLGRHIRRPFWAFSNKIAPAVIREGRLVTESTGGTSMECVLAHVAATRPEAAVVVTDGYIEELSRSLVAQVARTRLHALVVRDGNPDLLAQAGIAYTQLEGLPQ